MPEHLRIVPYEPRPLKQTKIIGIDIRIKRSMSELKRLGRLERRASNLNDLTDIRRMNELRVIHGYVDTFAWPLILDKFNLDSSLKPKPLF